MAKIESKLNGVTEQMRSEIKLGLKAGIVNVQKELEKMMMGMFAKRTSLAIGKAVSGVTEARVSIETKVISTISEDVSFFFRY